MGSDFNPSRIVSELTINNVESDFVGETQESLHVYANGTTGDDNNSGLSADKPKKTLAAAISVFPFHIKHNSTLHLAGTFSGETFVNFNKYISAGIFIIDGGDEKVVLSGPHSVDISSVSSIGNSSLNLDIDQYAGYHIEILSGPAIGQNRLIQGNTSNTLTPVRNFTTSPVGGTFQITRPATTFSNTGLRLLPFFPPQGTFFIQRLFLDSNTFSTVVTLGPSRISYAGVILNNNLSSVIKNFSAATLFLGNWFLYNPDTFAFDQTEALGFSYLGNATLPIDSCSDLYVQCAFMKSLTINNSTLTQFYRGSRISGSLELNNVNYSPPDPSAGLSEQFDNSSGYASTKIGDNISGPGLKLFGSKVLIDDGVDFSNNSTYGIEASDSNIKIDGNIVGSGNSYGMRIYNRSIATILDGSPPTLSGSNGEITIDGNNATGSWSSVDAGSFIVDTSELTVIKEE